MTGESVCGLYLYTSVIFIVVMKCNFCFAHDKEYQRFIHIIIIIR